jgi:hypothetical protein
MYRPQYPQVLAPPPRRRGIGIVTGLIWLAAGGLVIGATFAPFYGLTQALGEGHTFEYHLSGWSWGLRPDDQVKLDHPALYGIPLCMAGAVLVLAAILTLAGRNARVAGVLGTGLLVGAVGMELADAVANSQRGTAEVRTPIELGTWLLIGAAVLALVGTVLALARKGSRTPQMATPYPARFEPETPRFGIPVQQPGAPTPPPGTPNPGFPTPPTMSTPPPGFPAPPGVPTPPPGTPLPPRQ